MNTKAPLKRLFFFAAVISFLLASVNPVAAQAVNAAANQYEEGGAGEAVTITGTISEYGSTTFQYGTHGIVEDETSAEYALTSESVDLYEYDGERVTISGTFVEGYGIGEVENGPPLVEVSGVQTVDGGEEPPEGMSINGTVLEANADSILVEDTTGGQYVLAITEDTGFVDGLTYNSEDAPPRNPNASDLRPGLTVQVLTTGPVAESFPAQGEAASITFLSEWYEDDADAVQKTLSGFITALDSESVTVNEDPSLTIEDPQYCNVTIQFFVEDGTGLYTSENGKTSPATLEDFAEGQPAEVAYTEDPDAVYPAICPTQRTAGEIVALNPDAGDDNGNDNDSGGSSGGGSGNVPGGGYGGEVASDSYEVLPDTGGPGLIALAAGAAVVAAGTHLLVRNRALRKP